MVTFMPRRPYFPPGTLRQTLAYPRNPSQFTDEEYANALHQLRLDHLVPSLDRKARWDKELADAPIQLAAKEAVIELRGTVKSADQRKKAVELAESTEGVDKVVDLLEGPGKDP